MLAKQFTPEQEQRFREKQARWRAMAPEEDRTRAKRVMAVHDALPPEWRALVHEYGLSPILSLYKSTGANYRKAWRALTATHIELED